MSWIESDNLDDAYYLDPGNKKHQYRNSDGTLSGKMLRNILNTEEKYSKLWNKAKVLHSRYCSKTSEEMEEGLPKEK